MIALDQESVVSSYTDRVFKALRSVSDEAVRVLVDVLVDAQVSGQTVFVVGNGGSATTASHMVTDLGVGSQRFGAGVRAFSLSDNSGVVTAVANDAAFDGIFSEQLQLLAREGDVLVAISASGNSPNLLKAAMTAQRMNMRVVSLTGFSGGHLKELADVAVHVETEDGDYGPAEDAHLVLNHMVTEMFRHRVGAASDSRNLHG